MTDQLRFNGPAYVPEHDQARLSVQYHRIFGLMKDAQWRTLSTIANVTGDPQASISAQLRHMRKERFGSHTVEKKRVGTQNHGLFAYRLVVNPEVALND